MQETTSERCHAFFDWSKEFMGCKSQWRGHDSAHKLCRIVYAVVDYLVVLE